jgi:uncharacterized DUF497 family protein
MRFEWDGTKAASNLKKYSVSLDGAVTVFYDPLAATFGDPDHSQDESRLITVGYSARGRPLGIVSRVHFQPKDYKGNKILDNSARGRYSTYIDIIARQRAAYTIEEDI